MTRSFIKFDISGIPSTATISNATLRLYVTGWTSAGGRVIAAAHPASSWSENAVTWNNMPGIGDGITTFSPTGIGWVSVDITQAVREWVSGTRTNNGLALVTSNSIVWFGSRENSGRSPTVSVIYN